MYAGAQTKPHTYFATQDSLASWSIVSFEVDLRQDSRAFDRRLARQIWEGRGRHEVF